MGSENQVQIDWILLENWIFFFCCKIDGYQIKLKFSFGDASQGFPRPQKKK